MVKPIKLYTRAALHNNSDWNGLNDKKKKKFMKSKLDPHTGVSDTGMQTAQHQANVKKKKHYKKTQKQTKKTTDTRKKPGSHSM